MVLDCPDAVGANLVRKFSLFEAIEKTLSLIFSVWPGYLHFKKQWEFHVILPVDILFRGIVNLSESLLLVYYFTIEIQRHQGYLAIKNKIGEINALNASLAVIKFKQLQGFYFEEESYYHSLFLIEDHSITGISESDED